MLKPRIAENEQHRLQVINAMQLLDSKPEQRFDRLTRLARRVFDVPIALVSIVDLNRQWFKSCIGLAVNETSRDDSFCGHAILGDDVFVIPDAIADVRFFDNPLVTAGPHIRFYAGCPLRVTRSAKIGTLCIIDTVPRIFSADDIACLKDLAAMAEDELAAFHAATTDSLTGVWNRLGFLNIAQSTLASCMQHDQPIALLYLDLDGFKPINDAHGHSEGDAVLRRFADGLMHSFRSSDAVARMGGDEFVVLLPGADQADAMAAVIRLRDWLDATETRLQLPYRTRFSSGCVFHDSGHDVNINDLLSRADTAMYRTKRCLPRSGSPALPAARPIALPLRD